LYILMFKLSDSNREDRRFWTEWQQALPEFCLLLICSRIKFWFVTVLPKYPNSKCMNGSPDDWVIELYGRWKKMMMKVIVVDGLFSYFLQTNLTLRNKTQITKQGHLYRNTNNEN
jgi:hypothetical protein